jgi:RNA polymerase sigma factor for flagellar operon FliA
MTQPLTDAERERLIRDHLSYVRAIATKIKAELSAGRNLDLEELVAYGSKGLVEAAGRFDPARGVAFTTYAHYRIRGAIFDGLRELGWLSRSQYGRFAAGTNEYLENRCAREQPRVTPDPDQTLTELGEALDDLTTIFLTSLTGRGAPEPVETLTPAQAFEIKESCAVVQQAMGLLPPRERQLLELFYFDGLSLLDAGRRMGLSKSWCSRLHARAIRLLGQQLDSLQAGPA